MAFLLLSLEFSAPARVASMPFVEHNNNMIVGRMARRPFQQ
jgi:hypothetical protein